MLQQFTTPLAAGAVSALSLGAAAVEPAPAGPDFAGIALVISAVAGLMSAVTAMVIALRRKPNSQDEATVALLQQIADNLKDEK